MGVLKISTIQNDRLDGSWKKGQKWLVLGGF